MPSWICRGTAYVESGLFIPRESTSQSDHGRPTNLLVSAGRRKEKIVWGPGAGPNDSTVY